MPDDSNPSLSGPEGYAAGKTCLTTLECIDRMSRVEGVKYVEPNYPMHFEDLSPTAMLQHISKLGMKASGVALRYPVGLCAGEFTNRDRSTAKKAIELTNEAADVCRKLGATNLTIWSTYDGFDYPFQVDYAQSWRRLVDALREVAQANPDLRISIEYKPYEPRPFYFIDGIGTVLLAIEDAKCDNLGVTLDVCHMLMKKESPAYCLTMAAERGRLHGIHLNEGYGDHDDGLMVGAVNLLATLELVYYLRKYQYDGVVFFDTFPLREDPLAECSHNIQVVRAMDAFLERIGDDKVASLIEQSDALAIQKPSFSTTFLRDTGRSRGVSRYARSRCSAKCSTRFFHVSAVAGARPQKEDDHAALRKFPRAFVRGVPHRMGARIRWITPASFGATTCDYLDPRQRGGPCFGRSDHRELQEGLS